VLRLSPSITSNLFPLYTNPNTPHASDAKIFRKSKIMKDAVIEIAGDNVSLTLHSNPEEALKYAVEISLECTSYSSDEIRDHLRQTDQHCEGDYRVILATAREIS
jgi:hypothetical protein